MSKLYRSTTSTCLRMDKFVEKTGLPLIVALSVYATRWMRSSCKNKTAYCAACACTSDARNLAAQDYLYDRAGGFLLLFCDNSLVKLDDRTKVVMKKDNIVKVEIACSYFNLVFEREKNLVTHIRNIIRKNKNNFLSSYFDILFKKRKKRLEKKTQKNIFQILYVLYYPFDVMYNYGWRKKKKDENANVEGTTIFPKGKSVCSTVAIFHCGEKISFILSSDTHLHLLYSNMRSFLFGMMEGVRGWEWG
ncbi:conserved Plasmodium protein, unknown function [Plasmodium ovale wallikeri]|uniref:Uncharacterized protein n=1 Tax=Plasmodium ovale wallikeri TaxID=864142 RepID=A0A1A8ZDA1_PLAOA|nr:conserved Plasmodium protein, unknown function [Plasmodium ovale wallikeri]